jgi:hypothetical protein
MNDLPEIEYRHEYTVVVSDLKSHCSCFKRYQQYTLVPLFNWLVETFIEDQRTRINATLVSKNMRYPFEITFGEKEVAIRFFEMQFSEFIRGEGDAPQKVITQIFFASRDENAAKAILAEFNMHVHVHRGKIMLEQAKTIGEKMDLSKIDNEMRELYLQAPSFEDL